MPRPSRSTPSRALAAAGAGANGDDAGATDDDSDDGGGGGGGGSAIVYVHSQHEAEKVADLLVELGITADFYHAQVEPAVRAAVHRRWLRGETQAIVATSAFGMGVHKADVRVVVHWTLPDSLVSLAQEWGRAGRDGEAARCVLLYSYHDKGRVEALLRRSPHDLRQKLTRLGELLSMCEERCCRRERLLAALGQTLPPGGCGGGCDVCAAAAQLVQEHDVSAAAACALRAVARLPGRLSMRQLEKVLRGSRDRKLIADGKDGLPEFGGARALSKALLPRMLRLLVARRMLADDCTPSHHGGFASRLSLGREAWRVVMPPDDGGDGGGGGDTAAATRRRRRARRTVGRSTRRTARAPSCC